MKKLLNVILYPVMLYIRWFKWSREFARMCTEKEATKKQIYNTLKFYARMKMYDVIGAIDFKIVMFKNMKVPAMIIGFKERVIEAIHSESKN